MDGTNEQDLGSVLTKEGRLLCFPNTIQHRVGEFALADSTKPGHRKILAMFLVDPHIPVLSTANVPPQRQDWWIEEVLRIPQFAQLPVEVFQGVVDAAEGLMTWEEAIEIRGKLMEERSVINNESIESLTVSNPPQLLSNRKHGLIAGCRRASTSVNIESRTMYSTVFTRSLEAAVPNFSSNSVIVWTEFNSGNDMLQFETGDEFNPSSSSSTSKMR